MKNLIALIIILVGMTISTVIYLDNFGNNFESEMSVVPDLFVKKDEDIPKKEQVSRGGFICLYENLQAKSVKTEGNEFLVDDYISIPASYLETKLNEDENLHLYLLNTDTGNIDGNIFLSDHYEPGLNLEKPVWTPSSLRYNGGLDFGCKETKTGNYQYLRIVDKKFVMTEPIDYPIQSYDHCMYKEGSLVCSDEIIEVVSIEVLGENFRIINNEL